MCVQCLTNTEFLLANGAVAAAAATSGARRFGMYVGWLRPTYLAEKKASAHMQNVAFIASLGLDPDVVLGPGPQEPSPVVPAASLAE
jgi:hypothetical protein